MTWFISHINRKQKKNEGESYSTLKEKMRDNSQMQCVNFESTLMSQSEFQL